MLLILVLVPNYVHQLTSHHFSYGIYPLYAYAYNVANAQALLPEPHYGFLRCTPFRRTAVSILPSGQSLFSFLFAFRLM